MTNSSGEPWSDNPNTPKVPKHELFEEQAGIYLWYLSAVFHGITFVIFLQCMNALLNPINRKQGGVKWSLVAHAIAMFSFLTVSTVTGFYLAIISFIDNRGFSGAGEFPPGIYGYLRLINPKAVSVVSNAPFLFNGWLADGLLLYRCYIIYAMSYWVIAFPCLMYLASFGAGIMYLFENSHPYDSYWQTEVVDFGPVYVSISLSLNVILTLMIIVRLVLHGRIIRNEVGPLSTTSGLTKFVSTILVESCALYAVPSILLIGLWNGKSYVTNYITPIFEASQVIGPFLIILRVANRTALTSDVASASVGSMRFRSQGESTEANGSFADGIPGNPTDGREETPAEDGVGTENGIEEVPRK